MDLLLLVANFFGMPKKINNSSVLLILVKKTLDKIDE